MRHRVVIPPWRVGRRRLDRSWSASVYVAVDARANVIRGSSGALMKSRSSVAPAGRAERAPRQDTHAHDHRIGHASTIRRHRRRETRPQGRLNSTSNSERRPDHHAPCAVVAPAGRGIRERPPGRWPPRDPLDPRAPRRRHSREWTPRHGRAEASGRDGHVASTWVRISFDEPSERGGRIEERLYWRSSDNFHARCIRFAPWLAGNRLKNPTLRRICITTRAPANACAVVAPMIEYACAGRRSHAEELLTGRDQDRRRPGDRRRRLRYPQAAGRSGSGSCSRAGRSTRGMATWAVPPAVMVPERSA